MQAHAPVRRSGSAVMRMETVRSSFRDEGAAEQLLLRAAVARSARYPLILPAPAAYLLGATAAGADGLGGLGAAAVAEHALLVEFNCLGPILPPGVVVLPLENRPRMWAGLLLVRQGWYRGGAFAFCVDLAGYPAERPAVAFVANVPPHPLVDPESGEVDLAAEFSQWDPAAFSVLHVLAYVKRLFYAPELVDVEEERAKNVDILKLVKNDPMQFLRTVDAAVDRHGENLDHFLEFALGKASIKPAEDEEAMLVDAFEAFSRTDISNAQGGEALVDWFLDEYVGSLGAERAAASENALEVDPGGGSAG